jgi:hypothetical protein
MTRYLCYCLFLLSLSLSCNNDKDRNCFKRIFNLNNQSNNTELGEEYSIFHNQVEYSFKNDGQNGYIQIITASKRKKNVPNEYFYKPIKIVTNIAIDKKAYQEISQTFQKMDFWCKNDESNQDFIPNYTLYIFKSTYKNYSKSIHITKNSGKEIVNLANKLWTSIPVKEYKEPKIEEVQGADASYFKITSENKPISFQVFIDGMKARNTNDSTVQFKIALNSTISCYETFQNGDTYLYDTQLELESIQKKITFNPVK